MAGDMSDTDLRAQRQQGPAEEQRPSAEAEVDRAADEFRAFTQRTEARIAQLEAKTREYQAETERVVAEMRREIDKRKQELQRDKEERGPQSLPAFLAQVSRLHAHTTRLLPRPHLRPIMWPDDEEAAADNETSSESSSLAHPSSLTDIAKKHYPYRLRPWSEFGQEVQQAGFARIHAAFAAETKHDLPSRLFVQYDEDNLLEQMPLWVLNLKGELNVRRTTFSLRHTLLKPVNDILNRYWKQGNGPTRKIFLDTDVDSVKRVLTVAEAKQGAQATRYVETLRKVKPDCLALYYDDSPNAAVASNTADDKTRLIAVGEHRPCHTLRAALVDDVVRNHLDEDTMLRLARERLARRESATASATEASKTEKTKKTKKTKTNEMDEPTYFAYALSQAYHYMLLAGVEFGYVAAGEVLVFLRIREDDATTLYYHVALFPVRGPQAEEDGSWLPLPGKLTKARFPARGDPVGEAALREQPVAQMASFIDLAANAERRPLAWVLENTARPTFPDLPPDGGEVSSGQVAVPMPMPMHPKSSAHSTGGAQQQTPPSANNLDIATSFLPPSRELRLRTRPSREVSPPLMPFCTQACLLGLVQEGAMDPKCPNYAVHLAAAAAAAGESNGQSGRHPLTLLQLAQRIQDQLYATPEVDCQCVASLKGSIGYPFKLTLTGFGYTLMGKGVVEEHRQRLVHESQVYQALLPLQGTAIPVHLGLVQLHSGYPVLSHFLQLPYMMLLSYAGTSIARSLVDYQYHNKRGEDGDDASGLDPAEVVRHRAAAAQTRKELADWGLADTDGNVYNLRWCDDVQRAMRIDFDYATVVPREHGAARAPLAATAATPAEDSAEHSRGEPVMKRPKYEAGDGTPVGDDTCKQ